MAGFVESREGLGGGYRLAKDPSEINLMEVLEILEGGVTPVKCCGESNDGKRCGSEPQCGMKGVWHDAQNLIRHFLKGKTLADTTRYASAPMASHGETSNVEIIR